ncbi:MAG: hypothetical protein PQ975_06905 [Methanobacterium sp.]
MGDEMRILIDTNIFIYRENHEVISDNLQKLLGVLNDSEQKIIIHPESINEIKRDQDEDRKNIISSKIKTYSVLINPSNPVKDNNFLDIVKKPSNEHDYVDNIILYSVYKNEVSFLLTEDKGIHKKAFNLGIEDRVLSIDDALKIFSYRRDPSHPPPIKKEKVYNLDLEDTIFDSLKEEYDEFEEWWNKICRQGRDCFVYYEHDGSIGAALIYKVENEPIDAGEILPAKNRLKIATLKVSSVGNKIGELFIRLSVEYSIINGLKEIYLTHFSQPSDYLVDLIEEYGFINVGKNKRGEDIFVKELFPNKNKLEKFNSVEISKYFYPTFYDGEATKKFIVPIIPMYHDRLFIDKDRQITLLECANELIAEGNTIKKAYLSHSQIKKMSPGDIVIFYHSRPNQRVTCLGVIEKVIADLNDPSEILEYVGKRTVYSKKEIDEFAQKPTTVILFTLSTYLPKPLKLNELIEQGILRAAPQSIQEITYEQYLLLKKESAIDERFTVN